MSEHTTNETDSPKAGAGSSWFDEDTTVKVATVGAIVAGAALSEAALIPGILIGVAAAMAPNYVPKVGAALQPMFRGAIRGMYKVGRKAREAAAEAKEQVHDIVAEVHAEDAVPAGPAAKSKKSS